MSFDDDEPPSVLPPDWHWMLEQVRREQSGRCLLCTRPITIIGIWISNDNVRLPYGLCSPHAAKDSRQQSASDVERVLQERHDAAFDPLPTPVVEGPGGYLRTLEEHMSLLRFLSDDTAIDHATRLYPDHRRILDMPIGEDPETAGAAMFPERTMFPRRAHDALGILLSRAQPYYWSSPLCRMVDQLAAGVPLDWMLSDDMLPSMAAFHWFAAPLLPAGETPAIVAFGWLNIDVGNGHRGLLLAKFSSFPCRRAGFPSGVIVWPFGQSLGTMVAHMTHVQSDLTPPGAGTLKRREATARFYAAAIALLHQRILLPHRKPIPRPTRRRWPTDAPMPLPGGIDVVVFRRALHGPATDEHHSVEWSCRWIVHGHWRNQWCPSLGRHQPIYILPHIKGPDDKPLKVDSGRLFAVIR